MPFDSRPIIKWFLSARRGISSRDGRRCNFLMVRINFATAAIRQLRTACHWIDSAVGEQPLAKLPFLGQYSPSLRKLLIEPPLSIRIRYRDRQPTTFGQSICEGNGLVRNIPSFPDSNSINAAN
jgi:hypothetical protein